MRISTSWRMCSGTKRISVPLPDGSPFSKTSKKVDTPNVIFTRVVPRATLVVGNWIICSSFRAARCDRDQKLDPFRFPVNPFLLKKIEASEMAETETDRIPAMRRFSADAGELDRCTAALYSFDHDLFWDLPLPFHRSHVPDLSRPSPAGRLPASGAAPRDILDRAASDEVREFIDREVEFEPAFEPLPLEHVESARARLLQLAIEPQRPTHGIPGVDC